MRARGKEQVEKERRGREGEDDQKLHKVRGRKRGKLGEVLAASRDVELKMLWGEGEVVQLG